MTIKQYDYQLAHAVARIGLGINIALHGWTRIPAFSAFQSSLRTQFDGSLLPLALVDVMAYVIVALESGIGLLLLLGLFLRPTLLAGSGLMWILLFGSCLIQNWGAAGSQMVYLAFFAVLLATARYDRFSVDGWRKRLSA